MEFASYIASRYLRSRRHSRFLSRGSMTAVIGIAIGVMVLNITLAIMNGFHAEMRRSFIENMPMITVITSSPAGFADLGGTMDDMSEVPGVEGVAPYIRQEILVTATRNLGPPRPQSGIAWGIEPYLVDGVQPLSGQIHPDPALLSGLVSRVGEQTPRVIIGSELANNLFTQIGDTIILTSVNGEIDLDEIKAVSRKFVVIGYFETGMYEFDSRFVYLGLQSAQEFFGYGPGGATLIGARVTDPMLAEKVAENLDDALGSRFHATAWMTLNSDLFHWIKLEKIVMFLLLGMIVLIAGFNIIGILTMMVGERGREIGILLAMGTPRKRIMGIFMLDGFWLGTIGVAIGSAFGLAGIWALSTFGFSLPGEVYFIDKVPVLLQWGDFFSVAGIGVVISLLAGVWPSWEASNLKPMEIIRYT